jgi:hypothetical protein
MAAMASASAQPQIVVATPMGAGGMTVAASTMAVSCTTHVPPMAAAQLELLREQLESMRMCVLKLNAPDSGAAHYTQLVAKEGKSFAKKLTSATPSYECTPRARRSASRACVLRAAFALTCS